MESTPLCSFVFGGEGGIFCELRRLPCASTALSLPPFRKPVAAKTVPWTVFSRPSNPFRSKQKSRALHDFFVLAEKEGLDFAVPEFLFGSAFRFAVKIRPLQLSRLTAPVPDSVRRLPPRLPLGFKSLRQQKQKEHVGVPAIKQV